MIIYIYKKRHAPEVGTCRNLLRTPKLTQLESQQEPQPVA